MTFRNSSVIATANSEDVPESIVTATAGRLITKIWKIKNSGSNDWDCNTTLKWVAGLTPADGSKSLTVPPLKSGQKTNIWINFRIPSDIACEQIIESNWTLSNGGVNFGKPLCFKIRAIPNLSDADDCAAIDEDKIEYPPCFDLSIPFEVPDYGNCILKADHDGRVGAAEPKEIVDEIVPSFSKLAAASTLEKSTMLERAVKKTSKSKSKLRKPDTDSLFPANKVLIPVPSSSTIRKIKEKNETNLDTKSQEVKMKSLKELRKERREMRSKAKEDKLVKTKTKRSKQLSSTAEV